MGWNLAELQEAYAEAEEKIPENIKGTLDMRTTIELIDVTQKDEKDE